VITTACSITYCNGACRGLNIYIYIYIYIYMNTIFFNAYTKEEAGLPPYLIETDTTVKVLKLVQQFRYSMEHIINIIINTNNIESNKTKLIILLSCISYIVSFDDMFRL
jgi:hypothetical protein